MMLISNRLLLISTALLLAGCSALNPFAAKPKNAPAALTSFTPSMAVRTVWSANVGKAGDYVFTPAFVNERLGFEIPAAEMQASLEALAAARTLGGPVAALTIGASADALAGTLALKPLRQADENRAAQQTVALAQAIDIMKIV